MNSEGVDYFVSMDHNSLEFVYAVSPELLNIAFMSLEFI